MPIAPFGKSSRRIKLAKYTVGIPRRHSEALIKHSSEALLVFPLTSSVSLSLTPSHLHPPRHSPSSPRVPRPDQPVSREARLRRRKKTRGEIRKQGAHFYPNLS